MSHILAKWRQRRDRKVPDSSHNPRGCQRGFGRGRGQSQAGIPAIHDDEAVCARGGGRQGVHSGGQQGAWRHEVDWGTATVDDDLVA